MREISYAAAKMFAMNCTRPQQTSQPPLSGLIYNPPSSYNVPSRSTNCQSKGEYSWFSCNHRKFQGLIKHHNPTTELSSSSANASLPTPLDLLPVLSPVSAWRAALPGERSYFNSTTQHTHSSPGLHLQSPALNSYHHHQHHTWGDTSYQSGNFTPSTTTPLITTPSPSNYSGHNMSLAHASHTPNNSPSKNTDSSTISTSSTNEAFFSQAPGNTRTTDASSQPITACP
ncbi:unnamed protein product [Rodentolepis nana]|uniref:GATA-type domain-containing protein n=1 Tax=Rodentolepis nana TaxID=102285 RepID=A0A0R3TE44_RODNA|nr:unnamed protein product [Rodentolepis nana]